MGLALRDKNELGCDREGLTAIRLWGAGHECKSYAAVGLMIDGVPGLIRCEGLHGKL